MACSRVSPVGMLRALALPACAVAIAAASAGGAMAQQDQQYETPQYTSAPPATLDKNYGLPTFGMPGSELPQQRTMATDPATAKLPEFYKVPTSNAMELPKVPARRTGDSDTETPLFTTSQGSSTDKTFDDSETSSGSTTSSDSAEAAAAASGLAVGQ